MALAIQPAPAADAPSGLGTYGHDLGGRQPRVVRLGGYFRLRGELLHNLDLDHGPTPSGELLFPVPIADPRRQLLTRADMRLRTDLGIYAPRGFFAVKVRIDALDNLALGSAPVGIPSASSTQGDPVPALRIKRAYAELLTPLGLLVAGRMGNHWGLGMLANSGDCRGCDSGDAADRIAFVVPALQHVFAIAYDITASGPFVPDRTKTRVIDIDPWANVHTVTGAVLRQRSPVALTRRRLAGRRTFEWGAYGSYRWQRLDIPATYLPTAQPPPVDAAGVMVRGYEAAAVDPWLRFTTRWLRLEGEGAFLHANVDQPSLVPGVELPRQVTSNQGGFAVQTQVGRVTGRFGGGLDGGYASGDAAPGFGAFPGITDDMPVRGDLDGPQAAPPYDNTVDNFRFHPDYRIDRILFREIIGTVTDAAYLRPHVHWHAWRHARGQLTFDLYSVLSMAAQPRSTPGQARPLGVEIDPGVTYRTDFGLEAALDTAVLLPLAGLDAFDGTQAKPAQLYRLRLQYDF